MLKNAWIKFAFPYALLSQHKKAKQDTIRVVGRASAKLPHYMGHALIYPMENEMSFVHHVIKRWECDYTNKDNKGLSERT
jgi:hypothetical protein